MQQTTGKATADILRKLIKQCGSTVHQACKRSGVTPSTFYRWQSGSEPSATTVKKMRAAIVDMCTVADRPLPAVLLFDLDRIVSTLKCEEASQKIDLAARVDRLEKVVTEQLGAVL